MNRLTWITLCFVLSVTFVRAEERPNVIVIFTDDHGFADVSSQGVFDDLKTPNIDRLAAGGVRMSSGYVTAPQCVPSRAGLLSGRYQNRFGVESNGLSLAGFRRQTTLAERLRKAGYATGMTGKWHLGQASQIVEHGFDDVYYKNANRPGWANFGLDGSDRTPGPEQSQLYHLDANSEAAAAFIRRHHDEPFFFYCAYRAPHVPLDAPPKYLNRFPGEMPERRRQALAMISAMDDGVGRIISTLREYEIEERTIIFFIADNGAPLKIHKLDAPGGGPGWDGSLNDPLNGEKGMLTEGGIRVPFFVYWKDHLPAGRVYDEPVISLDVAATANALAGLPSDPNLDGVDLIPYLTGAESGSPHEALYWRWVSQSAIREGKWKYLRAGSREYLFDLSEDISETKNLLGKNQSTAADLRSKLEAWTRELEPPGLATKDLSRAATNYFDFYLDGKPAPPPSRSDGSNRPVDGTHGWIIRNGAIKLEKDGLRVVPSQAARRTPFLARAQLKTNGPANVLVDLKTSSGGRVGVSWRLANQDDFVSGQTKSILVDADTDWQNISLPIESDARIIHIRVTLPSETCKVRKIELKGVEDTSVWKFGNH
ncbi:MAG: sulfatase-like hydrolase/transferase [Planctomycetota bacterium]